MIIYFYQLKYWGSNFQVLSTPYMKSNNGITLPQAQHQQVKTTTIFLQIIPQKKKEKKKAFALHLVEFQVCEKKDIDSPNQDLRSRGLCLVPISSTFPVTNATTVDFWTPTFGGSFR